MIDSDTDTMNALRASLGKTISWVRLREWHDLVAGEETTGMELFFTFENSTDLIIWDDGQQCCEERFMRTDDDLTYFSGAAFLGIDIVEAPSYEDEQGFIHEIEFLNINTSKGIFQIASHNDHNGYYSGFWIRATLR